MIDFPPIFRAEYDAVCHQHRADDEHRIRIDELELDPKVQDEVAKYMPIVNENNIAELGDIEGYRHDFLATNGFDIEGIDYDKDVERMDTI